MTQLQQRSDHRDRQRGGRRIQPPPLGRMLPLLPLFLLLLSLSHVSAAVHASGVDGAKCESALQPRCPWTRADLRPFAGLQPQPTAAPPHSPFTFPYLQRLLAAVEAGSSSSRHSRGGSMLQLRPDAPLAPLRPGALVGGAGAGAGSRSKLSERVGVGSGRAQLPQAQGGRFQLLERIHVISAGAGSHSHVAPWRGDSQQADSDGTESTALVEPGSSLQLDSYDDDRPDRLGTAPHSEHALATTTTATIPSATSPLSSSRPASAATSGLRGDSASGVGGDGGGAAGAASAGHDSSGPGGSGSGVDHEYELRDRVGRGHFGEVWRARRIDSDETSAGSGSGSSSGFGSEPATYVLKRLFVERGYRTRLSGLREIHFGLKVRAAAGGDSTSGSGGDPAIARHVSRLVEWFEEGGALWLVFRDEGLSLSQLMWTTGEGGAVVPSERWTRMKMQTGGIPTHFGRASQQQRQQQQSRQRQRNEPVDDEEEERERRAYVQAHATDVAVLPSECAADDHASGSSSGSGDREGYPADAFGPFLPSPPPSTVSLVMASPPVSSAVAPVPLPLGLSAHEHEKDSSALQLALRLGDGEGAGDWGHLWPSIAESAPAPTPVPAATITGALPFRQPAAALPTSSSSFDLRSHPVQQPRVVIDPSSDSDTDGEEGGAQADPFSSSQSHAPHAVEREFPHDDFKNIFYQLLQSLAALHQLGITHRDIKPANILLRARATRAKATATSKGAAAGTGSPGPSQTPASPSQRLHLRVCDLGSAVDSDEALNALLYPPPRFAPSRLDNTLQYAPPEVLFGGGGGSGDDAGGAAAGPAYSSTHPHSYDLWSAGVVALELLLGGSANVFRIDERVRARVEARVEEALAAEFRRRQQSDPRADSEAERAKWTATVAERKEKAALFRALIEYGVYPTGAGAATAAGSEAADAQQPSSSSPHGDNGDGSSDSDIADGGCSDEHFSDLLRQFDPTGIGAPDRWLVKLIRRLLRWHPAARLSAAAALGHAYFRGAFACGRCGAQFEFESQLQRHHFEQHGAAQQHAAG